MLRRKSSKTEEKAKKVEKAAKAEKTPSAPAPVYRKAKPDIYTVFLVMALVAVLVGILFLYLELQAYDFKHQGGPPVAMVRTQESQPSFAVTRTLPFHASRLENLVV